MIGLSEVVMDYLHNELYQEDVRVSCEGILGIKSLFEKRILITGATGLIGSFLVDMLRYLNRHYEACIQIYAVSRHYYSLEERFGKQGSGLHFVVGDICNEIELVSPIDYVVHAAANSYPALFREDPTGTIMKNVEGTRNVLEKAKKCGAKRFIFISSGEVYGQYANSSVAHCESENGMVDILSPRSCYPLGKQVAENLCVCYGKQYDLPIVIARLCHTFGPNAVESDNRAHMQFIRKASSHNPIILKSKGLQERSYLYIADSATAIFSILIRGEDWQAYNVASGETITIRDFAKACADLSECDIEIQLPTENELIETSPIERQVLDGGKLKELGWKAQFSIREGIKHSVQVLWTL